LKSGRQLTITEQPTHFFAPCEQGEAKELRSE
jgi:hypothetical protein